MTLLRPVIDVSRGPRQAASDLLASGALFRHLRDDLGLVGLQGEETGGVALFFVSATRFRRTPLRLAIDESTGGGMNYAVNAVCELLGPGVLCRAYSSGGWRRFQEDPDNKIVTVSGWNRTGMSSHCDGDTFARSVQCEQGGRVVDESTASATGRFVCICSEVDRSDRTRGRWLRLKLPKSLLQHSSSSTLDDDRKAMWIEVQKLLQERAQIQILLPDWSDLFFAYAARNDLAFLHMPAFLESWKTMALLRSFQCDSRWQHAQDTGFYVADFSDLAHTGAIIRAFTERANFPALQSIFEAVCSDTQEFSIESPLTDSGKRYRQRSAPSLRTRRALWKDLTKAGHI